MAEQADVQSMPEITIIMDDQNCEHIGNTGLEQANRKQQDDVDQESNQSLDEDVKADVDDKNRKRDRDREAEIGENLDGVDEPKTKKAALERLRNMEFATRDPFKNKSPGECAKFSFLSRPRDRSPTSVLRKSSIVKEEREIRRRERKGPSSSSNSNRRRRSRSRNDNIRQKPESNSNSAASLIESRHQRSTMFFLQNEQRAMAQMKRPTTIPTKPLQERIETLLAKPDNEVLALPAAEIRALILRGVELFKEQENFLTGRRAQLIELDSMIAKERDDIERISHELPSHYRPSIIEEFISTREHLHQQQQESQPQMAQQPQQQQFGTLQKSAALDFTVPPPTINLNNELTRTLAPISSQWTVPPPSIPTQSINNAPSHFGQTPSLLFTKPPPNTTSVSSSTTTTFSVATSMAKTTTSLPVVMPNTSVPPPNLLQSNIAKPELPTQLSQNVVQIVPSSLPSTFSIPPPTIMNMCQPPPFLQQQPPQQQMQEQQQNQQHVQIQATIPSLMSQLPPPQILLSNVSSSSLSSNTTGGVSNYQTVSTSVSAVQSPLKQPNFSIPPPALPVDLMMFGVGGNKPSSSQQQQQQQPLLNITSNDLSIANFMQSQIQQLANIGSNLQQLRTTSNMSPSLVGGSNSTATASASPKQAPRPLMSIDLGLGVHHQTTQSQPISLLSTQQFSALSHSKPEKHKISAEITKASISSALSRNTNSRGRNIREKAGGIRRQLRAIPSQRQKQQLHRVQKGYQGRSVIRRARSGDRRRLPPMSRNERILRKRYSTSPINIREAIGNTNEAEMKDEEQHQDGMVPSPLAAAGMQLDATELSAGADQQADSSTNFEGTGGKTPSDFDQHQISQKSANEAESSYQIPPNDEQQQATHSEPPIVVQAADTTISSTDVDEMLVVSP